LVGGDVGDLVNRRPSLGSRLVNLLTRLLAPLLRRSQRDQESLSHDTMPGLDYRRPWVAAWLAVLPGCGCLYNRRPVRAVVFATIYLGLLAVCLLTLTWQFNNWLLGLWVLWVLYCYNDALVLAIRHNGQFWTLRNSLAAYSYLLFAVGVLSLAGQFFLSPVFTLVILKQNVMRPTLCKNDRLFVWKAGYWFHPPRRGDVVFYDPPRYQIEIYKDANTAAQTMRDPNRKIVSKMEIWNEVESTIYVINERRSFERVNAVAGDIVERKAGGRVMLNGAFMPKEYLPLVPDGLPSDFRIQVPPDKVCVLISHFSEDTLLQMGISFGGTAPSPGTPGVRLDGWNEACIVGSKEISGRATAIYHPPARRRWLTGRVSTSESPPLRAAITPQPAPGP